MKKRSLYAKRWEIEWKELKGCSKSQIAIFPYSAPDMFSHITRTLNMRLQLRTLLGHQNYSSQSIGQVIDKMYNSVTHDLEWKKGRMLLLSEV